MAIKFKWEVSENNKWITWQATWDGEWKNDPLYDGFTLTSHPFCRTVDFLEAIEDRESWSYNEELPTSPFEIRQVGDIVANNPATVAICEMLSDQESLGEHSGSIHALCYRERLFGILSQLWD